MTDQHVLSMLRNSLQNVPREYDLSSISPLPEFEVARPDSPDVELAGRILAAYRAAVSDGAIPGDGLWRQMSDTFHLAVSSSLNSPEDLAVVLAGLFQGPISAGICRAPARFEENAAIDAIHNLQHLDTLVSFGAALGLCPHYHGGLPKPGPSTLHNVAVETLFKTIEASIGFDLTPVQAGGIFGIRNGETLVPWKYLLQAYMAHRLDGMCQSYLKPRDKGFNIVEIGGGVGFLAEIVCRVQRVQSYTILDLPLVNMMQAYYLLKSELANRVQLYGETPPAEEGVIRVFPTVAVSDLTSARYDVALNQDSFPEMDGATIDAYLDFIQSTTNGFLYSINQESALQTGTGFVHPILPAHLAKRSAFKRTERNIYWLRKGYVEEVYLLNTGSAQE